MIISLNNRDLRLIRAGLPVGATIGLTSGCFDLFHHMHLVYLERCARLCDFLIVGLDSDDLVRSVKGPDRPNIPETQRIALVNAMSCVGATFIMGSVTDFETAARSADVDFVFKNDAARWETVAGVSGKTKLVLVPDVDFPDSTSKIVDQIARRGLKKLQETLDK